MRRRPLLIATVALALAGLSLGIAVRTGDGLLDVDSVAQASVSFPLWNQASPDPESAVLPANWPLEFLTLPPKTKRARLNSAACPAKPGTDGLLPYAVLGAGFNQGGPDSGAVSLIGLRPENGYEGLSQFIERQLSAKGYSRHWDRLEPDGSRGREWISPDSMFIVQVYFWSDTDNCHLAVFEYDAAQPSSEGSLAHAG